jgi:hypothetical protein
MAQEGSRALVAHELTRRLLTIAAVLLLAFAGGGGEAAAQVGSTILPTDVTPLPGRKNNRPFSNTLQLRLWQKLPASFYFNTSVETTFRIETNPYQYPLKRTLLHQNLPLGTDFNTMSEQDKLQITSDLAQVSSFDNVHRITPNGTAGWSFGPNTQVFVNSFLIRDSLIRNYQLNSTTGALGIGAQHTINLGDKASLQPQVIARELWQSQQVPVLDYLPGLTAQYNVTNNLIVYVNALLQVRFAHFVASYMREIDPFYTWGWNYQKGNWVFSASSTFVQNFRQPFHSEAIVPINNYSFICDFEIDRPLINRLPGLVSVFRAEPVYNFHSKATPGLAGMDFRFYYGVRLQAAKPPLNQSIQQLRQRYTNPDTPVKSSRRLKDGATDLTSRLPAPTTQAPEQRPVSFAYLTLHGNLEPAALRTSSSQLQNDRGSLENMVDESTVRLAL